MGLLLHLPPQSHQFTDRICHTSSVCSSNSGIHDCPSSHKGIALLLEGNYKQGMTFCSEYKALHDQKTACSDDELITLDEDRNNATNMQQLHKAGQQAPLCLAFVYWRRAHPWAPNVLFMQSNSWLPLLRCYISQHVPMSLISFPFSLYCISTHSLTSLSYGPSQSPYGCNTFLKLFCSFLPTDVSTPNHI